jgi:acetyl-CoA acetyltransferase
VSRAVILSGVRTPIGRKDGALSGVRPEGLPETVAGVTVNRLCASGLSAVVAACHAIAAGDGELYVAGGVESMSRAPLVAA